jgi:CheY-like chemotaxis protein
LILLDAMMPVMSGLEVVSKVLQRFGWTELRIVKSSVDNIIDGLECHGIRHE